METHYASSPTRPGSSLYFFIFDSAVPDLSSNLEAAAEPVLQLPPAKSHIVTGKAEKEDQRPTATGCPYTACGHGFLARDASGLNIHNVCLNGSQILVARMHHTHDIKRTGTPT